MSAAPMSTHLFLIAFPIIVSIICIAVHVAGSRHER
jgi:hypothetical protein